MALKISAVIITFNEEKNIVRCIESIQTVADEIIVIDSFSTDRTAELCANYPVRFIQQAWLGYGAQKNFGNEQANHNYILSVDADEVLSPELISTIQSLKKEEETLPCYFLDRLNYYYSKFLHHGFEYPDYKPRLFDRRLCQWNSRSVHEDLNGTPKQRKVVAGYLWHYTYCSITEHVEKANKYTTLAAKQLEEQKKVPSFLKIIFSPAFTFFSAYIIRKGFLDGRLGFVLACMHAYGCFLKYAKQWNSYNYGNKNKPHCKYL